VEDVTDKVGVVVSTRPLQRKNRSRKKRLLRRENLRKLVMTLRRLLRPENLQKLVMTLKRLPK
jgi:hypothetical protein